MSVVALDLSTCREGLGSMRRSGMQSWHERGDCSWEDPHWFVSSDKDSALTRFFAPTQFSVPLKLKLVSQHRAPCCRVATCCLPIKATLSALGTLSCVSCVTVFPMDSLTVKGHILTSFTTLLSW